MKFIFVTGGVVSGLGKGMTAASLGRLLKNRGYKVANQKLDPYINVDPGTMSPYEHGEVFVTEDGAETDLDLGHYERFTDENLTGNSSITSGKIYLEVENNTVNGLIMGVVEEKDDIDKLTNDCAKTGSVIELIVKNNIRGNGIGKNLLEKLEEYFKSINCKRINIEVFGPNKKGLNFYEKNDYVIRDYIVSKKL